MSEQKRDYSSIKTFLPGRLRLLAPGEEHSFYHGCLGCEPAHLAQGGPKVLGLPETTLDFLETINAKLDMLLSIVSQDHLQNTFPVSINIVEISGAGLIFTAGQDFKLEDRVELVMFLSQLPLRVAAATCRIRRRDEINDKPAWVVDFSSIRESDREAIVRYVFQQQREQIRESKQWT